MVLKPQNLQVMGKVMMASPPRSLVWFRTRRKATYLAVLSPLVFVVSWANATSFFHPTYQSPEMTPWPKPLAVTNGTGALTADDVDISTTSTSAILIRSIQRCQDTITDHSPTSPITGIANITSVSTATLTVVVSSDAEELDDTTDESYTLHVGVDGKAIATAPTVFGGLRALETFAQLFEQSSGPEGATPLQLRGLPWAITDTPRFRHRGMLIDSARHFLPVDAILAHVDAMAALKLNLLHWHLVDFQSFPVQSEAAPGLGKGAYSSRERYELADLTRVVLYAKDRGVRVMPEIDTPGHTASWRVGYPDIVTACPDTIKAHAGCGTWGVGEECATLDPTNNHTYRVLERLLGELATVFSDSAFHLGGDEVHYACWNESAHIKAYMRAKGYGGDFARLEAEYESRLLAIAAKVLPHRTVMVYQEVFDNNITLPDRVVFGVWKPGQAGGGGAHAASIPQEVSNIVKAGHQVVLANGNNGEWYLNDGFGNGEMALWPAVYALEPLNGTDLSRDEASLVIGGEASLWGEEINANNLQEKAWPRGAAFAERMWSARSVDDPVEAAPRLARAYCRLVARGIRASPIGPGSCFATTACSANTPGC
jgi:hexosaminidase